MSTPSSAIPRWLGVTLLLATAATFASNHIAARFAFAVPFVGDIAVLLLGTLLTPPAIAAQSSATPVNDRPNPLSTISA